MKRYGKIITMASGLVLLLCLSPSGATRTVKEKETRPTPKTTSTKVVVEETNEAIPNSITTTTTPTARQQLIAPLEETLEPTFIEPTMMTNARRSGEQVGWWVMATTGGEGSSAGFQIKQTMAQFATGKATSLSYELVQGYWGAPVEEGGGGGCCLGLRGNANGDATDLINISDVTFITEFLFGIPLGPPPVCNEEANANGDPAELVNISDITFLVEHLFGVPLGPAPDPCP